MTASGETLLSEEHGHGHGHGHGEDQGLGTVGKFGEFRLISLIKSQLAENDQMVLGPGDDAALVAVSDGRVVATTDLLVADRHFRVGATSAIDLGIKAAAANLADIAAMGAVPTALLLGLALPADTKVEWVAALVDGVTMEGGFAGAAVVGGDIVASDTITIAVTALGDLQGREPLTRSGAQAGDQVAMCGQLGWSAAGLEAQERGEGERFGRLIGVHHHPTPLYAAGPAAARKGATSLIDTSDGLLADLGHIAAASGVRIDLDSSTLSPDDELREAGSAFGIDPMVWVLTGGEDHAFVATFPEGTVPPSWKPIGRVSAGSASVTVDGGRWTKTGGFDHFNDWTAR